MGTQESLLAELGALDEARSKLAAEHGRRVLEIARRARPPRASWIDAVGKIHFDHHVEQVVRTIQRPILIAGKTFKAPGRFVIAYDGSATGYGMFQAVAQSPLLAGVPARW